MKSLRHALLTLAALPLLVSPSLAADDASLAAALRTLDGGVRKGEVKLMLAARAQFAGLALDDAKDMRPHYGVALASWRATPMLMDADKGEARRVCEEGLAAIGRAIKLDAGSGEAFALKAALQGLSLSFNPMAGMVLGPEMEASLGRAEGLAPKSPRVALLTGMNTLHKPAFVGGGADKAEPLFAKAIALAAAEATLDSTAFGWGHVDAHIWAGRSAEKQGKLAEAVAHYRGALAIDPLNGWAKAVLLPKAEKALALEKK